MVAVNPILAWDDALANDRLVMTGRIWWMWTFYYKQISDIRPLLTYLLCYYFNIRTNYSKASLIIVTGNLNLQESLTARSCLDGLGLWAIRSISSNPGFKEPAVTRRSGILRSLGSGVTNKLLDKVVLYEAGFCGARDSLEEGGCCENSERLRRTPR